MESTGKFEPCPTCHKLVAKPQPEPAPEIPKQVLDIKTGYKPKIAEGLKHIADTLKDLIAHAQRGSLPKNSYYFYATTDFDYKSFATILHLTYTKHETAIVPFITIADLSKLRARSIYRDSEEGKSGKFVGNSPLADSAVDGLMLERDLKSTYDNYVNSDICILTVGSLLSHNKVETLTDLLIKRYKLNRPTIVFGDVSSSSEEMQLLNGCLNRGNQVTHGLLKPVNAYEVAIEEEEEEEEMEFGRRI